MSTIAWIRRVAALGLVVAAGVPFEVAARAQATGHAGGGGMVNGVSEFGLVHVSQSGVIFAPPVPVFGIGPVVPSLTPSVPLASMPHNVVSPNATIGGGFGGFGNGYGYGFGEYGFGIYGVGGSGYPGMYGGLGGPIGGFGGPFGVFGAPMLPTPGFGNGLVNAGNPIAGPTAGMGMGVGGPADPNAPPVGGDGPVAIGGSSENPFGAAGAADRLPSREIRSRRAHAGRRPAARKPARRPSGPPEDRAPEAERNRSEVKRIRDEKPAAAQEKPADAAQAEGTKAPARPRSMLGPQP